MRWSTKLRSDVFHRPSFGCQALWAGTSRLNTVNYWYSNAHLRYVFDVWAGEKWQRIFEFHSVLAGILCQHSFLLGVNNSSVDSWEA